MRRPRREAREPFGTLILTLAVTGIEVMMIAAIMYAAREILRSLATR